MLLLLPAQSFCNMTVLRILHTTGGVMLSSHSALLLCHPVSVCAVFSITCSQFVAMQFSISVFQCVQSHLVLSMCAVFSISCFSICVNASSNLGFSTCASVAFCVCSLQSRIFNECNLCAFLCVPSSISCCSSCVNAILNLMFSMCARSFCFSVCAVVNLKFSICVNAAFSMQCSISCFSMCAAFSITFFNLCQCNFQSQLSKVCKIMFVFVCAVFHHIFQFVSMHCSIFFCLFYMTCV